MEKKWILWWVEKKQIEGEAGSPHWHGHVTHQWTWHTEREYHSSLTFCLCIALFRNIYSSFSILFIPFIFYFRWKQSTVTGTQRNLFGSFWIAFPHLWKCCCSIMHDLMHNLPLDFLVTMCVSTLFLHTHLHYYCLLWGFCIHPHTCPYLHTGAQKHICIQAHGAFGSCWELPVYLINSTWLEAKDMQTRKGKINNTKIKYFPPDLLWRKRI